MLARRLAGAGDPNGAVGLGQDDLRCLAEESVFVRPGRCRFAQNDQIGCELVGIGQYLAAGRPFGGARRNLPLAAVSQHEPPGFCQGRGVAHGPRGHPRFGDCQQVDLAAGRQSRVSNILERRIRRLGTVVCNQNSHNFQYPSSARSRPGSDS